MDDLTDVDQVLAMHGLMFETMAHCTLCSRSVPPKPPYCPVCHRPGFAWEGVWGAASDTQRVAVAYLLCHACIHADEGRQGLDQLLRRRYGFAED